MQYIISGAVCAVLFASAPVHAATVGLWLFDEPAGAYPSTMLNDAGPARNVLVLGRGGAIVPGRFGNALAAVEPTPLKMTGRLVAEGKLQVALGQVSADTPARRFGLVPLAPQPGRSVPPMTWTNATFAALSTCGETHLRSGGFPNATETRLNLGNFDWTVEFWFAATDDRAGVIFEIGTGPRGENDVVTRMSVNPADASFTLFNQPAGLTLRMASSRAMASGWHHYAFVYDAQKLQLRHYVDGVAQGAVASGQITSLPVGEEAYFTVARDGQWQNPLPGKLDELRISDEQVYRSPFAPPPSFSSTYRDDSVPQKLVAGPILLFEDREQKIFNLGSRKHLFLDDALVAEASDVSFVPNPPLRAEKVIDSLKGHQTLVDDGQGLLRIYYQGPDDSLAVVTSRDGVHWEKPDLGREIAGERNIVCDRRVGLGTVFIDPNAPPAQRWKYVSGVRRQAVFVFTSPDGWWFEPHETAALPFSSGSQSTIYYDDQRQVYAAHHRSDYGAMASGSTRRRFVLSEVADLMRPWPYQLTTPERTAEYSRHERTHVDVLDPWFLDNGPLAPGGFGIELPTAIATDAHLDPEGTDVYVTKAIKYPWAPDAYVAFPTIYFHYWDIGPETRRMLGTAERGRGSGVTEVQLAVSRDGRDWQRYPRPAYAPIGGAGRNDIHMLFMVHGIARRGDELWQFVTGHGGNGIGYHSAWNKGAPSPVWRLVQRLDGFVAAEGSYRGGTLTTKPLTFRGKRLHLNIDTGAVGYAQVGIRKPDGEFLPGYGLDDCVYINGDFLDTEVEWLKSGSDVSALANQPVQLVFRLQGAKLFALQFE